VKGSWNYDPSSSVVVFLLESEQHFAVLTEYLAGRWPREIYGVSLSPLRDLLCAKVSSFCHRLCPRTPALASDNVVFLGLNLSQTGRRSRVLSGLRILCGRNQTPRVWLRSGVASRQKAPSAQRVSQASVNPHFWHKNCRSPAALARRVFWLRRSILKILLNPSKKFPASLLILLRCVDVKVPYLIRVNPRLFNFAFLIINWFLELFPWTANVQPPPARLCHMKMKKGLPLMTQWALWPLRRAYSPDASEWQKIKSPKTGRWRFLPSRQS